MKVVGHKSMKELLEEFQVVSQLPCVLKCASSGLYAPKGWYWASNKPWTFDIQKAKVYRNSAGAKNALRGSGIIAKVLEFHKELKED
jgi:hypothetical protein